MDSSEGIQRILDGEAVLFLGAGFSIGATNTHNKEIMIGRAIADHFAGFSGLPPGTELEEAAEAYVEDFGVDALIREIQDEFTAGEVTDYQKRIATLPWKRIYTTNYDNVFEVASRLERQNVAPITTSTDIYKIPKNNRVIIHLNGFVDSLDREKIMTELKLTDSSYVTASISDSKWAMLLRQDIKIASAVFFLGYSLYDIDIRKILIQADVGKEKSFFYLGPSPEEVVTRRVRRYGSAVADSCEGFVEKVQKIEKSYTPRDKSELMTLALREFKIPSTPTQITDRAFIDLLLWGQRNEGLITESLRTNTTYYLYRSHVENVVETLKREKSVVVITSDIGNGKSMVLEGIRLRAVEQGYRVFDLSDDNGGVDKDIEAVAISGEKVLLIIEEYQNWLDQLRLFSTNAGDQAKLIITARNAVHDVIVDDLSEIVGYRDIVEINVDTLADEDIEWFVDALDEYGLWASMAGQGRTQKINFIQYDCRRQTHALLLNLLQSPDIGERIVKVAKRLEQAGENYQQLLSIFILTILNHGPTLDVLVDIWGSEKIRTPQFRTDPLIKELVSFNYYAPIVRSPIAAEHILSSFTNTSTLVSVLVRMAQRIEKGKKISPRYNNIFKSLMRFGSIQTVLPREGLRPAVISYYESLKNLNSCNGNPLFWLQYAIASLVIEDLPRAKTYFETAYSLAKKQGWDTFQIDNHFSRFLMKQAIQELDFEEAYENYQQARTIIDRQMRNERRHYPYRVAILFQDFLNRFKAKMNESQVDEFVNTSKRILDQINSLPEFRRRHRYVNDCKQAMIYILDVCQKEKKT